MWIALYNVAFLEFLFEFCVTIQVSLCLIILQGLRKERFSNHWWQYQA